MWSSILLSFKSQGLQRLFLHWVYAFVELLLVSSEFNKRRGVVECPATSVPESIRQTDKKNCMAAEFLLRKMTNDESVQSLHVRPELIVRSSTFPPSLPCPKGLRRRTFKSLCSSESIFLSLSLFLRIYPPSIDGSNHRSYSITLR
jgi:hypothetical protein